MKWDYYIEFFLILIQVLQDKKKGELSKMFAKSIKKQAIKRIEKIKQIKQKSFNCLMTFFLSIFLFFSNVKYGHSTIVGNFWELIVKEQALFLNTIIPRLVQDLVDSFLVPKLLESALSKVGLRQIEDNINKYDRVYQKYFKPTYDNYQMLKNDWRNNYFCLTSIDKSFANCDKNLSNVIGSLYPGIGDNYLHKEVSKTMFMIDADLGYINDAFSSLQNKNIPDIEKRRIALSIANLQYIKQNLANSAVFYGDFIRKANEYNGVLRSIDGKIEEMHNVPMQVGLSVPGLQGKSLAVTYTSEQAKKDLLKVQILNTLQIIEQARFLAEDNLRKVSRKNLELTKQREKLVSEMAFYKRILSNSTR